jgi:DNA-binding beta-propeller fold protein YncE
VATGLDRGPDGLLYVANFKNDRVQVLRPDGTPVSVPEGASEGDRGMSRPTEVATADRLYVVDHGNDQIDVYNK